MRDKIKIYEVQGNLPIHCQINEYLRYCQFTRQMSSMTLRSKQHTFKHFIDEAWIDDLSKIDNAHINRWIAAETNKGVAARTINTRLAHIMAMLRYYREMGLDMPIRIPLVRKLKEGPVRRLFYTRSQINQVLSIANDLSWLLIRISFDSGLRISELRNLRLGNFHGQMIKFIGKGFKPRESYITKETYARLQQYVSSNHITDALWLNDRGRQYSTDEIRIIMRKTFHEAGFDDFYPHALRHSFATDIQSKGAELLEMQQMLGHSNAQTTERYIHGLDGQLGNLFAKYKDNEPVEA